MSGSLSRFHCPQCDTVLTPWLRPLAIAEALCPQSSWTTLVPAEHFVHRDDPVLRGQAWPHLVDYPWRLAPLSERWMMHHPDIQRTIGCCGLSYRGPEHPNLVCACGEAVGLGYCDCCGPHWYALHASVRREEAEDEEMPLDLAAGLAHLRRICGGPAATIAATRDNNNVVLHDEPGRWSAALRLTTLGLACGGGEADPELLLTSPQLPDGIPLVLPIPRGQLVRLIVLQSVPWGEPELPMTWQGDRSGAPQVQVSRRDERVLVTLWPGQTVNAVTVPAAAWTAAWVQLCG